MLVRPEDILAAVRSSMLLGAVLPELRAETEALAGDLAELVRLRNALAADRQALERELAELSRDQERMAALVEARQARIAEAERGVGSERARAAELGREAQTLKELIERMEREVGGRPQGRRRRPARRRRPRRARRASDSRPRPSAIRPGLRPKIPFAEARGLLPLPVGGQTLRSFGDADGLGGTHARHLNFDTPRCCRRPRRPMAGSPSPGRSAPSGDS